MRKKVSIWNRLLALLLVITLAVPSVYIPAKAEETSLVTEETTEETSGEADNSAGSGDAVLEETLPEENTEEEVKEEDTGTSDNSGEAEELEGDAGEEQVDELTESETAEESEEETMPEEETEEASTVTDGEESQVPETEEDYTILTEVEEEREEYSKTFFLEDGSFMVAQYDTPIHYEDEEGNWKNIDYSLESVDGNTKDDDGTYETTEKSGKKETVSFSKKVKEGKTVKIKGQYPVSWGFLNAAKQEAVLEKENGEEQLTGNEKYLVQTNLNQKIQYEEVYEGVDVEYIVSSENLKENIVLKQSGTRTEFESVYDIGKLTAVQKDEKTIQLMDGDKIIYQIQAPYMVDANGIQSDALSISITETKNEKITVKVKADETWLAKEEREYPVVIDPILLNGEKTDELDEIDTTFIAEDTPSANYSQKLELLVGRETSEYGNCRTLVRVELPELDKGDILVDAQLRLVTYNRDFYTSATPDLQINAHQITSDWDLSTVNWNNKPSYDTTVLDYDYIKRSDTKTEKLFDITSAAKTWTEGTSENYGILIKSHNENGSNVNVGVKGYFWPERYNAEKNKYPLIQVTYRNNKGLEDYWNYTELSAGTAGTAYINDYSGNLVFIHDNIATSGLRLPISLQHVYNGYMATKKFTSSYPTDGRGWKLNLQQTVKSSSAYGLSGTALARFPYAYEDEDGTVHFFEVDKEDATKYYDEDGLGLELTVSGNTKKITDMEDNVMTFGAKGNLTSITDANGNKVTLTYTSTDAGINQITKIKDGSGHVIQLTPSTSGYYYLLKLTGPDGKEVSFSYPDFEDGRSGYLQKITYPDNTHSDYTYDTEGRLKTAVSCDGSGLEFYYNASGQVIKVVEFGTDKTEGQTITFDRSKYNTTIVRTSGSDDIFNTEDDLLTTYQFDNYGRTVSFYTKTASGEDFGGEIYSYTKGTNIKQNNRVASSAYSSKNTRNYLNNHSGENTESWTKGNWIRSSGTYEGTRSTSDSCFGKYAFKLTGTEITDSGGYGYYQDLSSSVLIPGESYTFSSYVKTSSVKNENASNTGYGACLILRYTLEDGSYSRKYSEYVKGTTDTDINNGWKRISYSFTIPAGVTNTRVGMVLRNATGTAYFDGMQVEKGLSTSAYNMLENGSFENVTDQMPDKWTMVNGIGSDKIVTMSDANQLCGTKAFKVIGDAGTNKYLYQQVEVGGTEEDNYIVSAWAKADALAEDECSKRKFDIYVKVYYSNGSSYVKPEKAEFNSDITGWQRASMSFDLSNDVDGDHLTPTKISVLLRYYKQENICYWENVQLIRDVYTSYSYDSEGNLTGTSSDDGESAQYIYDSENNLISSTNEAGQQYDFTYSNSHEVETISSPEETKSLFEYDDYGNLIVSEVSSSGGGMKIRTDNTMTEEKDGIAEGAYVASETDENGYVTTYDYNVANGNLNTVTTPDGVTTTYTYGNQTDLLESVTTDGTTVSYDYDSSNTRLSSIAHNGFQYHFEYDSYGNNTSTKVGQQPIVTYSYNQKNGKINTLTYGNGNTESYEYDLAGNINAVKQNDITKYLFLYNSLQLLESYQESESRRIHDYEYDVAGRLVREKVSDEGGNTATNDAELFAAEYGYDQLDQMVKENITANGRTYRTSYSYNDNNQPLKDTYTSTRRMDYGYDALGRLTSKTLSLGTPLQYNYLYWNSQRNGESTTKLYKTTQVARELIGEKGYRYTYDNMGNIVLIEEGIRGTASNTDILNLTEKISYVYDNKNQLVRENNKYIEKTIVYAYDGGGNIQSKTEYAYTTVSDNALKNVVPTDIINYSYNETWADRLDCYDGEEISYDAIGNPTSYRGKEMTWNGRSLKTVTEDGVVISYRYNSDGIRTGKVVGNTESEYYYSNGLLSYEKRGNKEFYYSHDSSGNLCRIVYYDDNGSYVTYYVATNIRGDVEAIYKYDGSLVASYIYDSWGNVVSVHDAEGNEITDTNHIGHLNPFRYRGYYYDTETGLYYLESRYYDSVIGRFLNADGQINSNILGGNLYAYCNNNPINEIDSSGTASYKNTIKYNKKSRIYNITTIITVNKKKFTFTYKVTKAGIVKFSFSKNKYGSLILRGAAKTLAKAIYNAAKFINKDNLSNRTINGIHTELAAHYALYKMRIKRSHTETADMGGLNCNKRGYDSNAWVFETPNMSRIVAKSILKGPESVADELLAYLRYF